MQTNKETKGAVVMNQILMFTGTNLERLQHNINEVIRDNELTIQSTQITSVMNPYEVLHYTVIMVVTK